MPLRDGVTWVLSSAEPAAYAGGLRHPKAVVTGGLLDLLDPAEQQAVCEHEGAHIRLGYPRLLLAGAVVARAYPFLPRCGTPGRGCAANWRPPPTTRPPG